MTDGPALLAVQNLVKHFPSPHGPVRAVDGISFRVQEGETLGLVGESGCGKTTTGRLLLRLEEPGSGAALFEGRDIFGIPKKGLREYRRAVQMVFQDPFASLDPRMTASEIVVEPLVVYGLCRRRERKDRANELLSMVGLDPSHANRFPHEFSGGQRQRIGIARALAVGPRLVVCDEPVSALDVSIQAQIINLLKDLQQARGLTYIFIAHDLSVVKHISDRVVVMYLGKVMEIASKRELFARPLHPYTRALLASIPVPDPDYPGESFVLEGDAPSPIRPPSGCRFRTRCPVAFDRCGREEPPLVEVGDGHLAACHRVPPAS
ncbi:MAG TPA: oligopeptide/dipeptide ABC transporter ATP-binding protein [Spirochaetia bacterium]|nr:oligopeptide/dipeptide ABC transporter ATP-binding protein [Spirochaetia bacterium]